MKGGEKEEDRKKTHKLQNLISSSKQKYGHNLSLFLLLFDFYSLFTTLNCRMTKQRKTTKQIKEK